MALQFGGLFSIWTGNGVGLARDGGDHTLTSSLCWFSLCPASGGIRTPFSGLDGDGIPEVTSLQILVGVTICVCSAASLPARDAYIYDASGLWMSFGGGRPGFRISSLFSHEFLTKFSLLYRYSFSIYLPF